MYVYVLHYRWENEENDGAEVLGVYAENSLAMAQEEMRTLASRRRNLEMDHFWQEDYTWEDAMEILLGHCGNGMYEMPEVYQWKIDLMLVKELVNKNEEVPCR